ncbi:MAG: phosphoglucosamine mutase, partial [Desulfamplus sp.]|nr:phosphoglucosamine mutase [Desulfamplus sp.]
MKKLFGTDGIRGVANSYPMTPSMAMNIGIAVANYVKKDGYGAVIIGKDTRISGDMLESALAAGITSQGVDVLTVGVIPTPAVAFLLSNFNQININQDGLQQNSDKKDCDNQNEKSEIDSRIEKIGAGIVISASHNPWQDNGIKIFKKGGWKLSDDEEESIESMIFSLENQYQKNSTKISLTGRIYPIYDAKKRYCDFLKQGFYSTINKQLKLVVDCSNGASSVVASMLFGSSDYFDNFDATFIFNQPDGKNINEKCGSQHTETLSRKVLELGADIGLAFDGDADRLIAIDETGAVITGDRILAICASYAKSKGTLENNRVVSTVMSNIGLARTLESLGIEHLITGVGDREVLQEMIESGAVMGGEDSGHMIFSQYHTTG